MTTQLLREYISEMLQEKIRNKSSFNTNQLKTLESPADVLAYAQGALEPLGQGTSRITFLLNSGKVLKIARPDRFAKGKAQNTTEAKLAQNPTLKPILTRVYDSDPEGKWLISELVRPITEEEFKKTYGLAAKTIFPFIVNIAQANSTAEEWAANPNKRKWSRFLTPAAKELMNTCIPIFKNSDLELGDVEAASHWGRTGDSRLVLLDYGLTSEVWNQHYALPTPEKATSKAATDYQDDL